MAKFEALVGMNYAGKRAELGDVVSDLPTKSISWLVEQGHIVPVTDSNPSEPESPVEGTN